MKKVSIFFSIKKTRKVTNDNKNNINKCTIQALAFWEIKTIGQTIEKMYSQK